MNAQTLLNQALQGVESNSIRAWVQTDHNLPLWLQYAEDMLEHEQADPARLTLAIVCEAIGL
jgi:hypothetical protein